MDPLGRFPIMEGLGSGACLGRQPRGLRDPPLSPRVPFGGGLINSSTRMLSDLDGRDVAVGVLAMSDRHI